NCRSSARSCASWSCSSRARRSSAIRQLESFLDPRSYTLPHQGLLKSSQPSRGASVPFFNRQWFRRKPVVFSLTLVLIALLAGNWLTLGHLDRRGREFFETGRAAVTALDRLSGALTHRDYAAAGDIYAPGFQG